MALTVTWLEELEFVEREGRRMIRVPWAAADEIHSRLRAAGIDSTLHLRTEEHEALLEPWADDLRPERVRELLEAGG